MRNLNIKELDGLNDLKNYLTTLCVIMQGFYLGANELDTQNLKVAFGEIYLDMFEKIDFLKSITKGV